MDIEEAITTVWNYHHLHHPLKAADVMIVLGSHDLRVATYAAELFHKNMAPVVVCSGGAAHHGDLLNTGWDKTEAEIFRDELCKNGVPEDKVLIENKARNTGENFILSKKILEDNHIPCATVLAVQKPYMERRTYATGKKQWPGIDLSVTSPPLSFDAYIQGDILRDDVINIMVGDLQRIDVYAQKGFQIPQDIPEPVRDAFDVLVKNGFDKHLIRE